MPTKRLRTEFPHYKCELWDGKGWVARWRMRRKLTRTAAMMIFLWPTEEIVNILLEYRNASY